MNKESRQGNNMVELSKAITRALIKSDEVLGMLGELKKNNQLQDNAMLAFILKTNALLEIASKDSGSKTIENQAPISGPNKLLTSGKTNGEYIDGRKFSNNEISFKKYCSDKFDEKEWLRELKLKL